MSLTGPMAIAALDEALRDIRREEDEILRKLVRGLERLGKFREAQGDLLRQYAAGRLAPDSGAALAAELEQASRAARRAARQRSGELGAVAERLRAMESAFARRAAERAAALAEVDSGQTALRALSARIASAIARQPDYERQRQEVLRLKAMAGAARARARQAELDREQKRRPYRDDPLFDYLQERGYDTPGYRATGIVARLDAWLAAAIGYSRARQNFALLNALPDYLRAHAEVQARRAAEAESALDEIEQAGIDAAGGSDIRLGLAAAQARMAAIDGELVALQEERDRLVAAQTHLTEGEDAEFEHAMLGLVRALGSGNVQGLVAAARAQGPGGEEALLAQLDDARQRVLEEVLDSRDQHARLATLAARRRGLEDLELELKARSFDDPRSLFHDDELVTGGLDGFLTGAIDADAYWLRWRQAQAWTAGTSDWGGGVGLPRHGRDGVGTASEAPQRIGRPRTAAGAGA